MHAKVVGNQHARHRRQKDRPARNHRDESRGLVDVVPGTHGDADNHDDIRAASDVDVFRPQCRQVHSRRHRVEHDAQCQLAGQEAQAREEGAGARGGRHRLLREDEDLEGVPEDLTVELGGGRGDEDAAQSRDADRQGCGDGLAEKGSVGSFGVSSPVWLPSGVSRG